MHTITCSFQAEILKKRQFYLFFSTVLRGRTGFWCRQIRLTRGQFFSCNYLVFLLKHWGYLGDLRIWGCVFYYKYLRNQGRKRCKTNVNFQLYIVDRKQALRSKVSCRMEQFMKKRLNLFLLLLNTVEEKKVIFFLLSL